jgi:ABC-2 type transport system ATP-binding protein
VIEAKGLTKRYGDKVAVDGLSFQVKTGVVTGFLGPNGSGKSTTMRMFMGLDAPSAGEARVNGQNFHELRWPLREVGALLEARAVHPGRSARAHLLMLAQTNGISKKRVDDMLGLVGLTEVAHQRVGKFSLGMGQRLGIAVALLGDPATLFFDEPINGLDPDGIRWVRNLLKSLAREGRTIFVSSHLMSEMSLTADEVVIIGRGRLIEHTAMSQLLGRSSMQYVRVRSPELSRLRSALDDQGATTTLEEDGSMSVRGIDGATIGDLAAQMSLALHELAPQSASLEEAFMELTESSVEYHGAKTSPSSDEASA